MSRWPPIAEPLLRERLALDDAGLAAFVLATLAALPPRRFTPEALRAAFGYPWERPARSYLLDEGGHRLLDELPSAARDALLEGRARSPEGTPRYPLLAIGSNGAPATLARKLARLPAPERRLLVLAGELHDHDVGAAAHPTAYGALPATPFESPGTAVRAAVLWVSARQLGQLSLTELSYRLGRLAPVAFTPDQPVAVLDGVLAYVSRWGTFCPDGAPLALAAIPAAGRTVPALRQEELLERAAALLGLADAAAVVRAALEDMPGLAARGAPLRATGRPFAPAAWTPWSPGHA